MGPRVRELRKISLNETTFVVTRRATLFYIILLWANSFEQPTHFTRN